MSNEKTGVLAPRDCLDAQRNCQLPSLPAKELSEASGIRASCRKSAAAYRWPVPNHQDKRQRAGLLGEPLPPGRSGRITPVKLGRGLQLMPADLQYHDP